MRNRYPGTCYRCRTWVEAGEGHFERLNGRWRVQHANCAIRFRGVPDAERAEHNRQRDERLAEGTGKRAQNARRRLRDQEKGRQ